MSQVSSVVSTETAVTELKVRSIVLAIVLTILLAISNAFLALKLGILTSASIPAAIISMGVLRLFKNSNILENNAVQTAASAGEAVAGGIVYTIPALIIIGYWHHFDYFTNFFIAASGGILGVLFSIPLRRILVGDNALKFPEGRAIAEVLKSSTDKIGLSDIVYGSVVGAVLELFQVGFKVITSSCSYWFAASRSIFGLNLGVSVTMIGAGYLVGTDMAVSIFLGAIFAWFFALPISSHFFPDYLNQFDVPKAAMLLWSNELRYLGIGAMLCAGTWTFLKMVRPLLNSIHLSWKDFKVNRQQTMQLPRTDRDIPFQFIVISLLIVAILLFLFFNSVFPMLEAGLGDHTLGLVLGSVFYVLIVGFLFSVITAYFSGMVGVTASPGSSVVIAGILLASWLILTLINLVVPMPLSLPQIKAAEAMVIIISAIVTGIAAIANDNTQDLKVGQLVGATPWKQQIMLLLGVMIASLVIPPVMELLFNVYGIAGVMPRAGMDISQSLPAPTAALLAAVTEAVFSHQLPWLMLLIGALMIVLVIVCYRIFKLQRYLQLSALGVAIGMYLPMSSSFPLFLGGLIAWIAKRLLLKNHQKNAPIVNQRLQVGTRIACGLVAGSALLDVLLAIPFSIGQSPDVLSLVSANWDRSYGIILSIVSTVLLGGWMVHRVTGERVPRVVSH